jgi:hypothetical protein
MILCSPGGSITLHWVAELIAFSSQSAFAATRLPERLHESQSQMPFQTKNPSLSKEQSLLAADVSLQIVRGMMTLYGEADPKVKVLVVAEFKKVLTLYLGSVLSEDAVLAK